MIALSPHDLLLNIVISLCSSVSTTGAPLGINGILKKEFNYLFEFEKFENEYDTIFGRKFHPPDGFLRNKLKKIAITVECKSGIDDDQEGKLTRQLSFYSENENFKNIFIGEDEQNELLIVCLEEIFDSLLNLIRNIQIDVNLVIWSVREVSEERYNVKKRYGNHIDLELNKKMETGVLVLPPSSLILITHSISHSRLVSEIGKRILANFIHRKIEIGNFIKNQKDSIFSYLKMRKAISHFLQLTPELGKLEDNIITFKEKPDFEIIQEKIKFISQLNKKEIQHALKEGSLTREDMNNFERIRQGQFTLERWFKKQTK